MYNIVRKNNGQIKASYETELEAQTAMLTMGPQRNFFRIEKVEVTVDTKALDDSVFEGAVKITRENVKFFYKKEGFIRVVAPSGKVLHTGKTTNMGKIFSNYVNCARYNQCYDFDLEGGDTLWFKEHPLKSC